MMEDITADLAIRLLPGDTVAVVLQPTPKGSKVTITGPGDPLSLTANEDIPCFHKLSLSSVQSGQALLRNGIVVGRATREIEAGDWVHTHNLASLRARHEQVGAR